MRLAARLRRGITVAATAAFVLGAAPSAWASLTGPDVSNWQHPNGAAIDWHQVKAAGHTYAFIKATEGPGGRRNGQWYTNPYFAADWRDAGAVGLARGAYHYAEPERPVVDSAVAQARYYVSVTGTMHGGRDLPPVLDMETDNGLSADELTTWARTWLQEVQRLTGRAPMIYTYQYFWQHQMGDTTALTGYRLWFARYTNDPSQVQPPGGWQTWTFWQYTSTGSVPGIQGDVDLNRFCCAVTNFDALANGAGASAYASNPFGNLDHAIRQPGGLLLQGWAIDPDTTDAVQINTYVDGRMVAGFAADQPSPDVAAAYPGFGTDHRFAAKVPAAGGTRDLCVYAINIGYGHGNPKISCGQVTLATTPYGHVDGVARVPGGIAVRGWTIDPDVADPLWVHVAVDGQVVTALRAKDPRGDIAAAYPGYGSDHGFSGTVGVGAAGDHRVCLYAINIGGGTNPVLGCRTVHVETTPFGHVDSVQPASGGIAVRGWTIDPDTTAPLWVHVAVDGHVVTAFHAGDTRGDIGRTYPAYGAEHGFSGTVAAASGQHRVCLYAINQGPGSTNPVLGCRTVTVP